jgi:DNA-binding CsgD family transcriptional regulator
LAGAKATAFIEVLCHAAGGNRNRDIGARHFTSEQTVKALVKPIT